MILLLVLLSALKDSKRTEETRAIKTVLRVPGRGLKGHGHKFQPKTQSQLPAGNHLPFLALEEIWPLFIFDREHWRGGRQPTGRGCSMAVDLNERLQPWS